MAPLSLSLIGWLYTALSAIALAFGAWLVIGIHFSGEDARRQLGARALEDAALFGIWILGLAGGIGVLRGKSWSGPVLELFCWVLMVLVTLVAVSRFRAAAPPRATVGLSLALFVVPVVALCGATIYSLRVSMAS